MSTNRLHITQATDRARLTKTAENNCRTADDKINLIDSDDILIFYYLIPSKKSWDYYYYYWCYLFYKYSEYY